MRTPTMRLHRGRATPVETCGWVDIVVAYPPIAQPPHRSEREGQILEGE